ncbi:LacI family transcriptional regulator [Amycolatopsis sp. OK19-0408]|uniref:LacI family transcriptional regulator n=1 Tax=Amycolatopsis iheyensis TaxID=2945988 RepID=A0A9X2NM75_9PSEU|nr:LacI family transcriptional regulator [Amycolatopsis iheyensis]
MKRPTITDIAREAGVSKGAVSYALNGRPGVSEATRRRITEIARSLGWSPSNTARALSGGRTGAIGLVLDRPPELFFPALLDGFPGELLLHVAAGREASLAVFRRWHAERRVDGVLLTEPDRAAELVRIGLPAVLLGGPGGLPGVPTARVDDTAAAAEALAYLAALGHRRVVRIAGAPVFADAATRETAFRAAAWRLGLGGRDAGGAVPGSAAGGGGDAHRRAEGGGNRAGSWTAAPGKLGWAEGRAVPDPAAGPGGRDAGGVVPGPAAGVGGDAYRSAEGGGDRGGSWVAAPGKHGWAEGRAVPDPAAGLGRRERAAGGHRWAERGPAAGPDNRARSLGDPFPRHLNGSPPRPAPPPTVHIEPSADTVRRLLAGHPRPTAVLCDTDSLAVAALVAARELGLDVPGDLSIVSWDDTPLCRLVRPALTAISRPLAELGALAVSVLNDLVDGRPAGDVCASRPKLVTRGSTGPAR